MCVAYPGTVIQIKGKDAVVDFGGNKVTAKVGLVDANPGDRVLVHAGCVLQKVTTEEAEEIESILRDMEASYA